MDVLIFLAAALFVLLIFTVLALLYASGLFLSTDVSLSGDIQILSGASYFYYKTNRGPYTSLGHIFTEAYSVAPNITQCGVYYDNSDNSSSQGSRAAVGVLMTDTSEFKTEDLEKAGFKKFTIPKVNDALYAKFPHTSFMSIIIGTRKIHPTIRATAKEMGCQNPIIIEVYDADSIHYIGVLKDRESYMVEDFATSTGNQETEISQSPEEIVSQGQTEQNEKKTQ